MPLSESNRYTLLLEVHRLIEEGAAYTAQQLLEGNGDEVISYPPNGGLSEDESNALKALKGNDVLESALRKVVASATADGFFSFFSIVDGVTDPDPQLGEWTEVRLSDAGEDREDSEEFLHDSFYESYWKWKELRSEKEWSLDKS